MQLLLFSMAGQNIPVIMYERNASKNQNIYFSKKWMLGFCDIKVDFYEKQLQKRKAITYRMKKKVQYIK